MNNNITKTSQGDFNVEPTKEPEPLFSWNDLENLKDDINWDEVLVSGDITETQNQQPFDSWTPYIQASKDDSLESVTERLEDLLKIQCGHGNYDYDEYMFGMANGMILAHALMTGEDPEYLDRPEEWLADVDTTIAPVSASSMVGTQPSQPEYDNVEFDHPSMACKEADPFDPWAASLDELADEMRTQIDREIIEELIECVEEEKVDDYERAMKGM